MQYQIDIDFKDAIGKEAHLAVNMNGSGDREQFMREVCSLPYFIGKVYGAICKGLADEEEKREQLIPVLLDERAGKLLGEGFIDGFLERGKDEQKEE